MYLVIGQNLGQNLGFREVFDVAVARAVAEMRILGFWIVFHLGFFQSSFSIPLLHEVIFICFISWILSSSGSCGWFVCGCKRSWSSGTQWYLRFWLESWCLKIFLEVYLFCIVYFSGWMVCTIVRKPISTFKLFNVLGR